jgi:uncharacterized protein (DUF885 family)
LFSLQPKTKFEIRRTEAFREKKHSAEYMQGTADGSCPRLLCSIPDIKEYNIYGDEDPSYRSIPGHHFQISLQQENALPTFENTIGLGPMVKVGHYIPKAWAKN